MSSNFPGGGGPDFYTAAGGVGSGGSSSGGGVGNGRSNSMISGNNNPLVPYRSPAAGTYTGDTLPPVDHRRTDLIGKRSFAELQHHQLLYQQQQFQRNLNLGNLFNFRNVKPRPNYNHQNSPAPVDMSSISGVFSPEMSSSFSNNNSLNTTRYGLPIVHQFNPLNRINDFHNYPNNNQNFIPNSMNNNRIFQNKNGFNISGHDNFSTISSNSVRSQLSSSGLNTGQETDQPPEKKMMNQLQELEKQLLGDDENDEDDNGSGGGGGDAVSVVTNSEWSDIQNLNLMCPQQKPISLSPTSSSSSSSCSSTPSIITCPKQSIVEAASAVSEGKTETATEILTRLFQVSNAKGNSEQRLMCYMATALQSKLKPAEFPPPVSEIYSKEHLLANQMLFEVSPCFKLGFMAANRAILEAVNSQNEKKVYTVHVIDFDIGQGGQYVHLLHALAAGNNLEKRVGLRITTISDTFSPGDERLTVVSDGLKVLANKLGVCFDFAVVNSKIHDFCREKLGVNDDEALVVNFAFKLYKLPDESVTTENLRDELLRRVKKLSPKVVTVVEQEMNANTAPLVARVNENYSYYSVLFDSLDATVSKESQERVKIEEGLSRSIINSVACEGRDRVERCEVFGKWRARMSMAGFEPEPISPLVADSLRSKLNSGTRGNPGFTVNEQSGGICFGWKGRTLTIASAWH